MAEARLSPNEAGQSSVEARRLSKDAGRSPTALKRSSNRAEPQAEAAVSVSMLRWRVGVSNNPTCGSMLASRTRSPAGSDPSGAPSRKISGWIVPKTEMRAGDSFVSVGPACVPADLRTNPRSITAIPNGIPRTPNCTNTSPNRTPRRSGHTAQPQRTSPDAAESKHADCGKNGSDRSGRRVAAIICVHRSERAGEPGARAQEFLRIDWLAFEPRLVVQVRTGRATGRTDLAQDLPAFDRLADTNVDRGEVTVAR